MKIIKAEYGDLPNGVKADVSKKVAELLKSGALAIEVEQHAGSPDLLRHPLDGRPGERLPEAPAIVGRWTERAMGRAAKDATRLKAGGFRKLEKDGDTWRDVT